QEGAAGLELAVTAGVQQSSIWVKTVSWRVDRLRRLVVVARIGRGGRKIGQVRNDEVDGLGERVEQIPLDHMHSVLDGVQFCVLARELDRRRARVGRPYLDVRPVHCE